MMGANTEATHLTLPPMMVLEHLYLGHVAVEATLLGLVLGATLSVSLGLFTVALCHLFVVEEGGQDRRPTRTTHRHPRR